MGCQHVIGGRVALWDGTLIDVNENAHPDLLWAMRGGAAAGVGVVTQLDLRLLNEPEVATWYYAKITKEQLKICVHNNTFLRGQYLPRDISLSFLMHGGSDQISPLCSVNIYSLRRPAETLKCLQEHLEDEVTNIVSDLSAWSVGSLLDMRMIPASDFLAKNTNMLAEITGADLRDHPLRYWDPTVIKREMADSFLSTVSSWVLPDCDAMLFDIYEALEAIQTHPLSSRMYFLAVPGGSKIKEQSNICAMPVGEALARFEVHWDERGEDEEWARKFTDKIHSIILSKQDPQINRPYRGDIWLEEQSKDPRLDAILKKYDKRNYCTGQEHS